MFLKWNKIQKEDTRKELFSPKSLAPYPKFVDFWKHPIHNVPFPWIFNSCASKTNTHYSTFGLTLTMTKMIKSSFLNFTILFSLLFIVEGQFLESGRSLTKFGSRIDRKEETIGDASSTTFGSSASTSTSDTKRRSHFQTSLVELDDDYDFNVPPPVESGDPVKVSFSINLRNVIQVIKCIGEIYPSRALFNKNEFYLEKFNTCN